MLSVPHLIIIFLVALVVLGPEKLPEVARVLGKAMAEFRKVTSDFRTTLEDEMREIDRHVREKERLDREAAAAATAKAAVPALPEAAIGYPAPTPAAMQSETGPSQTESEPPQQAEVVTAPESLPAAAPASEANAPETHPDGR